MSANNNPSAAGRENDNPYREGWEAFHAGRKRFDYPDYESFDDEAQWVDGWEDAERAAAAASPPEP